MKSAREPQISAAQGMAAKITVVKPTDDVAAEMKSCPTWSCGVSVFDWYYDEPETCLVLSGEVHVTTSDGDTVSFGAGDLVSFPQGLKCTWDVRAPVRKHFRFG